MSIFKGCFSALRLLLLSSLLLVVACTSPDDNNPTDGNGDTSQENQANFELSQSVQGSLDTTEGRKKLEKIKGVLQIAGVWRKPELINYTFTACLVNKRTRNKLDKNHTFTIVDKNKIGDSASGITEKDGCLRWDEEFDYNYYKDAQNIKIERLIQGSGIYGGAIPVELSLNPWADRDGVGYAATDLILKNNSVVIKKIFSPQNIDEQFKVFAGGQSKALQLENFNVSLKQRGKNTADKYFLDITGGSLYVNKEDIRGKIDKIKLNDRGLYAVHARLVEVEENLGTYKVLDMDVTAKAKILAVNFSKEEVDYLKKQKRYKGYDFQRTAGGSFKVSLPKVMAHNWTKGGMAAVVLQVTPLETGSLAPLVAVYTGQSIKSIRNSSLKMTRADTNDDYATADNFKDLFKDKRSILAKETLSKDVDFEAFGFTEMKPRFMEVMKGETSTARTVQYNVRLCISSRTTFSTSPMGREFDVAVTNIKTKEVEVHKNLPVKDDKGCISWLGEVYHKVYVPEKYYLFDVKVTESKTRITHKKTLAYAINPWGDNLVFSEDVNNLNQVYIDNLNQKLSISGRFVIPDFSYHTLRFRYEIDNYLNLKVKKTVLMRSHPKRLNYNSRTHGRYSVHPLRDGIYIMKLAMDKYYLDPSKQENALEFRKEKDEDPRTAETHIYDSKTNERLTLVKNGYISNDKVRYASKGGKTYDLKKERHLSVDKKLIRIRHGELITPFEFDISDLRMMRLRSQMVIQIDTINEQALWIINLYNDFYNDILARLDAKNKKQADGDVTNGTNAKNILKKRADILFKARRDVFLKEKAKSLNKIALQMGLDERFVDHYIKCKIQGYGDEICDSSEPKKIIAELVANGKGIKQPFRPEYNYVDTVGDSSGTYRVCSNEIKVTMADIARKFKLEQPLLDREFPNSYQTFESDPENIKDLSNLSPTNDGIGGVCVRPFNILRKLVLNDPIENKIAPIDGFDIDKLIDSTTIYEKDLALRKEGIPREAFTGPVTFVLNGNSSSMRTTKNLTESFCKYSQDCSQSDNEKDLRYRIEEMNHHKEVAKTNGYDQSRYYGSIKYLNDKLVDDLLEDKEIMNKIEDRKNQVESMIHYFLSSQNLKLYSLAAQDREITEVDFTKCPVVFEYTKRKEGEFSLYSDKFIFSEIDRCIKKNNSRLLNVQDDNSFSGAALDESIKAHLDQLYDKSLSIEEQFSMKDSGLRKALCTEISKGIYDLELDEGGEKYTLEHFRNNRSRKSRQSFLKLQSRKRFMPKCMKQLVEGQKVGVLSLERKLRVNKVVRNSYYYRAGKNMNLQVSDSVGVGSSDSQGGGHGGGAGLNLWIAKWGTDWKRSTSISKSEGVSVSEGTYLVMQDSKMDVQLERYVPCLIARPNLSHAVVALGLSAKAEDRIESQELDMSIALIEKFTQEIRSGLMICAPESNKRLNIREGYYYFTQHFTEGDMQDTGDLFNHPWMLQVRGKADMWEFVSSVRGAMNKKFFPNNLADKVIPDLIIGDKVKVPINLLIDVYQHVTPSFPGMFTMEHTTYPQDFPWDNQPDQAAANESKDEEGLLGFIKKYGDKSLKTEMAKNEKELAAGCPSLVSNSNVYSDPATNGGISMCTPNPNLKIEECKPRDSECVANGSVGKRQDLRGANGGRAWDSATDNLLSLPLVD